MRWRNWEGSLPHGSEGWSCLLLAVPGSIGQKASSSAIPVVLLPPLALRSPTFAAVRLGFSRPSRAATSCAALAAALPPLLCTPQ